MGNKHKYTGRAFSLPAGIGIGTAVSLTGMLIGAMILAWLIVSERVGENGIGWGSMVILPLSSAAGAWTAWHLIQHRRLMVCSIQCAAYYLCLLLMALPFGGQYEGMGVTALLVVLGGAIT